MSRLAAALRLMSTLVALIGTGIALATTDWTAAAVCGAAVLAAVPNGPVAPGVILAVLLVRPVRGWWASTLLAAACVPLVPLAAIGVALRMAATEATLRILGPSRKGALARLTAERRAALGVPPLDEALADFRKQLGEADLVDFIDALSGLVSAAWAQADLRVLVRTHLTATPSPAIPPACRTNSY
jgi:hypothetical protein